MYRRDFKELLGPNGETLSPPALVIYSGSGPDAPMPSGTTVELISLFSQGSYAVVRDPKQDVPHVIHFRQLTPRLDPPPPRYDPIAKGVSLEEITMMLGNSLDDHISKIVGQAPLKENLRYLAGQVKLIPQAIAKDTK